jgi:hypothetical protein
MKVTKTLQSDKPSVQKFQSVVLQNVFRRDSSTWSSSHMKQIHLLVLKACAEAISHQQELLSLMASRLNLSASQILYEWGNGKFKQWGTLRNGEWSYLFHGMDCDLMNTLDGRFLRVNFGPKGRTDTFTSWGITQFIMASKPPWSEFKELKKYLAKVPPPHNQYSGSLERMELVWSELEQNGLVEKADQSLLDFAAKHTVTGAGGLPRTEFPPGTSITTVVDCAVASRYILGRQGEIKLLGTR